MCGCVCVCVHVWVFRDVCDCVCVGVHVYVCVCVHECCLLPSPVDVMNPFAARDVGDRLLASPKTKEYMKDGGFREKLKDLAKDPQNLSK